MKNIFIAAFALFAHTLVAQDEPTFTIVGPAGVREVFDGHGDVINFYLEENTSQFYSLHTDTPISLKSFDRNVDGLVIAHEESRYEIWLFVAKLFNGKHVATTFARSYKGCDTVTVSISYLDHDEASQFPRDILDEARSRRAPVLTTPIIGPPDTGMIGRLTNNADGERVYTSGYPTTTQPWPDIDERDRGAIILPSPGYREHWFYWNGKWWGSDLPREATARLALMWFDDGERSVAWIENLNIPEKRLTKIKELFSGDGMVWSNDRIYAVDSSGVIVLEHELEPGNIKKRLLWAIKQSIK